jgi:hypothetical protein
VYLKGWHLIQWHFPFAEGEGFEKVKLLWAFHFLKRPYFNKGVSHCGLAIYI